MSPSPHFGLRSVAVTDLLAAVAAADWDRADALWPQLSGIQSDDVWNAVAEVHTVRLRWEEAAEALARIKSPDNPVRARMVLARNLAALKIHRPLSYRSVIDAGPADMYRIHAFEDGQQTVAVQDANGHLTYLSRNPTATVADAMKRLQPHIDRGETFALLSIGDGHVLSALSKNPPKLFLGREQTIFLLEPDPRLLLVSLLIHDFTGPTGPIEQQRVRWYVGERWAAAYRVDALTDRYLPFPQTNVKLGIDPLPLEKELANILNDLCRADEASKKQSAEHYAALSANDFHRVLTGQAGRSPRVMLVTTRFSSVLQYSTRDTADAFRRLGWDTQICIEPTPHHALTRSALRRTLAEFKPDMVFQIDHHRFEHADLFPQNLPFVNWIQDWLPHLMTNSVGPKLGRRDFVLAPSRQRWMDEFAYPSRQCMEFRKLTRVPQRPIGWSGRADQVTYVSNWSRTPEQARQQVLAGATGPKHDVLDAAAAEMIRIYAADGSLPSGGDVRRVLVGVLTKLEFAIPEPLLRQLSTELFEKMANLLHRQQGLRWAAAACEELGLKLQIYGNGWEQNPEFSRFAQGTIGYGEPLEELTRESGVSLVLEPFVSATHQRLLDALAAGGFCLMRAHPAERTIESMIELLGRAGRDVSSAAALSDALGEADRALLAETLHRGDALDVAAGGVDQVAIVRQLQRGGFLPNSGAILPLLEQTQFSTAGELATRLARYTRDRELAASIARTQRQAVEQRYAYAAGVKRMIEFVAERLAEESQPLAQAA